TLANAPGAGIAADKAVYAFLPELIKYYLSETPLLPQVPTYLGIRPKDFAYIREHAGELVIKTTGDSGGYNMLMGPFASKKETETYVARMRKTPGNYIAQPLIELSAHPTYVEGRFEARRIDLRPFILYGDGIRVLPGGLTRVALRAGSYAGNPYSIHFSVRKARENARSVREALTLEAFLAINETYHALETYETRGLADLPAFRAALTATQKGLFTILGAIDNTFARDETWRFLKLGEAVERLYRSASVLRVKLPALLAAEPRTDLPLYYTQWRTLLRAL